MYDDMELGAQIQAFLANAPPTPSLFPQPPLVTVPPHQSVGRATRARQSVWSRRSFSRPNARKDEASCSGSHGPSGIHGVRRIRPSCLAPMHKCPSPSYSPSNPPPGGTFPLPPSTSRCDRSHQESSGCFPETSRPLQQLTYHGFIRAYWCVLAHSPRAPTAGADPGSSRCSPWPFPISSSA